LCTVNKGFIEVRTAQQPQSNPGTAGFPSVGFGGGDFFEQGLRLFFFVDVSVF
jgi:hypothetical protein